METPARRLLLRVDSLAATLRERQRGRIEFACYATRPSAVEMLQDALRDYTGHIQRFPKVGCVEETWVYVGFTREIALSRESILCRMQEIEALALQSGCVLDGFAIEERRALMTGEPLRAG